MYYCIALMDSGNYVYKLLRLLEKKGYVFEAVSTPCIIAKSGCGYCLKFPEKYLETVMNESKNSNIVIREIYRIIPGLTKNKYEKI